MSTMQELKIQLIQVQKMAAELQRTINSIIHPRAGEPVPVQAICAKCMNPVFSNNALFTGGAHYHKECYREIDEAFARESL